MHTHTTLFSILRTATPATAIVLLFTAPLRADTSRTIVWEVECSRPAPYTIELIRGETVALTLQFLDHAVPLTLSNAYEVVLQYRDSALATDLFYAVTGSVLSASQGTVSIPWTPAREAAASVYTYTIAARSVAGQNLSGFGTIRLRGSVGGTATNMPRTYSTIDWASVQHLNVTNTPFLSAAALWQVEQDLATLASNTVTHAQLAVTTQTLNQAIAAGDIMGGDVTGRTAAANVVAIRSVPVAPLAPGSGQNGYGLKYNASSNWLELGPVATEGGAGVSNLLLLSGTSYASRVAATNAGIYRTIRPGALPSLAVNVGGAEVCYLDLLGITMQRGSLHLLNEWLTTDVRSYDGSASAPSHSFASDPGSGFYRFSYGGGYAVGLAIASNLIAYWAADGLHLTNGAMLHGYADAGAVHQSDTFVSWTHPGGSFNSTGVLVQSSLLTNLASISCEWSGMGFLYAEMSTGGTSWVGWEPTNVPVTVRLYSTYGPGGGEGVLITNIVATSFQRPDLFNSTANTAGERILVDDPQLPRQAVNLQTLQTAISNNTAAGWSQYPAVTDVDLSTKRLLMGNGWSMFGSNGVYIMTSVSSWSDASGLTIANNGVSVLTTSNGMQGCSITNYTLVTNTMSLWVATNNVVTNVFPEYSTNLMASYWDPINTYTSTYPTASNGSYRVSFALPSGSPLFFRIMQRVSPGTVNINADLTVQGLYPWRRNISTNLNSTLVVPRWIGDELVIYSSTNLIRRYESWGITTNSWRQTWP